MQRIGLRPPIDPPMINSIPLSYQFAIPRPAASDTVQRTRGRGTNYEDVRHTTQQKRLSLLTGICLLQQGPRSAQLPRPDATAPTRVS
jgi:hypothetical protein